VKLIFCSKAQTYSTMSTHHWRKSDAKGTSRIGKIRNRLRY